MVIPNPRVSVVIPAHNAARFLPETIAGVQAQTVRDWELIVVDDASTDDTAAVVGALAREDPRIRLVTMETPGGWGPPGRNYGFAHSNSASLYIAFLDHDDIWEPYALETLIAALEANPAAPAAHGVHRCIDAASAPIEADGPYRRAGLVNGRMVEWRPEQSTTFATLVSWCCIRTPGLVLARRSALPASEPFPRHDGTGLDWDLWLNLSRAGDFAFVNHVLLGYRLHDTNATRNHALFLKRCAAIRGRLWEAEGFAEEHRRLARASYRPTEAYMIRDKLRLAREELGRGETARALRQCRHALGHFRRCLRGRP